MNKRPAVAFGILFLTLVIDSAGCHLSEGFDYFKSLYLTIVTISTVGYGDVYARSTGGMIFALVLIIAGVGTMFYTVSLFVETLVENRLQDIMGREKMKRMIITMKKQYINMRMRPYRILDLPGVGRGKGPLCGYRTGSRRNLCDRKR